MWLKNVILWQWKIILSILFISGKLGYGWNLEYKTFLLWVLKRSLTKNPQCESGSHVIFEQWKFLHISWCQRPSPSRSTLGGCGWDSCSRGGKGRVVLSESPADTLGGHPQASGGSLHRTCRTRKILFFFPFIFISWRLITLQYCSGFCHTLTWISHGFTCAPHPDPHSCLPPHPIPLGLPSAPALSTCLTHPTWAGDLCILVSMLFSQNTPHSPSPTESRTREFLKLVLRNVFYEAFKKYFESKIGLENYNE